MQPRCRDPRDVPEQEPYGTFPSMNGAVVRVSHAPSRSAMNGRSEIRRHWHDRRETQILRPGAVGSVADALGSRPVDDQRFLPVGAFEVHGHARIDVYKVARADGCERIDIAVRELDREVGFR